MTLSSCTKENNATDDAQIVDIKNTQTTTMRIAAASNLSNVLPLIIEEFKTEVGLQAESEIEVTYASSGKLYAQIISGAPYDIFLSANQTFPAKVPQSLPSFDDNNKVFTYSQGQLALYSAQPLEPAKPLNTQTLTKLLTGHVGRNDVDDGNAKRNRTNIKISIANPELAPYGASAKAYLQSQGLFDDLLENKQIILAENIGQAFQYVHTGSVDYGFVAQSQLVASHVEPAKYHTLNINEYPIILQDGIVLSTNPMASQFADYLISDNAQKVFEQAGYLSVASQKP